MRNRSPWRNPLVSSCLGGLLLALLGCVTESDEAPAPRLGSRRAAVTTTAALAVYAPPTDLGVNAPPKTLASRASGSTPDGSDHDFDYKHMGYGIDLVQPLPNYHNAKRIKFNVDLIYHRNNPNLHQVIARAFHPYYVTKDENLSPNDCIGGWRLCSPLATYDMVPRKIASCTGLPGDCIVGTWTFQMIHSYLWGNQVSGTVDHCGDAEGNVVVIRVDPADPKAAYVWYVHARDDADAVHASNLDFTGAHPQFTNHKGGCNIFTGCMGSHHKQYARRTNDGDAHGFDVDNTVVFFHPGLEYDYKRDVDPSLSCEMPYHGYRCGGYVNENHDNDDARCNRGLLNQTFMKTTSIGGSGGPWGTAESGNGAFYGGYWNTCPLTSNGDSGWGIGLNASWSYGHEDARHGHPKGAIDNTLSWFPCGNGTCNADHGETCSTCSLDCGSCGGGGGGAGSCMNACGGPSGSCWCDEACVENGDCCRDMCAACGPC